MRRTALLAATLAFATAATAHGPTRQKITEEITISAPRDKVWEVVEDLCSIAKWHPEVEKCELQGKKRVVVLKGGYRMVDQLKKLSPEKFLIKYKTKKIDPVKEIEWQGEKVAVPAIPVANFSAVLQLKENAGKTEVVWKGAFYRAYLKNNPPEEMGEEAARSSVREFFRKGLEGLKKFVEEK